jgi:hypothetical protein
MLYQTVIGFYIDSHNGKLSTEMLIEKIHKLSNHLASLYPTYQWGIKDPKISPPKDLSELLSYDRWILDLTSIKQSFNDYADYIKKNSFEVEGCSSVSDPSFRYMPQDIDIESADFRFDRSFIIDEHLFTIYINTEALYASEIIYLSSANLGIASDMNDVDGHYYEFKV